MGRTVRRPRSIELWHLRYFVAASEHGSFRKAGAARGDSRMLVDFLAENSLLALSVMQRRSAVIVPPICTLQCDTAALAFEGASAVEIYHSLSLYMQSNEEIEDEPLGSVDASKIDQATSTA